MSEIAFIVLSALFLAVPVSIKYLLAFQARHLVDALKKREREVRFMAAQLESMEREQVVLHRALRQVEGQRRQVLVRRERLSAELERLRHQGEEPPVALAR